MKTGWIAWILIMYSGFSQPAGAKLALDAWTYIQVDDSRQPWGTWDEPGWLRYFGLAMADVTGDGYKDIVAGRYFYRNPGGDMSNKWPRIDMGSNVDGMLFVDVDGDAYGDVIATALPDVYWLEAEDIQAAHWKRTAIGKLKKTGHVNGQGYILAQIVPGGRQEILLACEDGVYCFEIPAQPDRGNWPKTRVAHETMDEGIGVGDLDADGDIDIVCGRNENEKYVVVWFANPGDGSSDWPAHLMGPSAHAPDRIVLADMNADGRLDVVVSEERYPGKEPDANLSWYEQMTPGAFKQHIVTTEYSLNNLDVADMDGDGDVDIITCEHKGPKGRQKLQIFENDGQGTLKEHIIDRGKESHLGARVADMDGDGDYDILSAAWDYPEFLHLWRNDAISSAGRLASGIRWEHVSTRTGEIEFADVGRQAASLVFDIDADGIDDFVVAGWSEKTSMVWFKKQGDRWKRYLIDQRVSHIEAGGATYDIDGDGDLDILQGGSWATNEVWWWENPYPTFDPETPWNRYTIKDGGAKQHHDQIFGDFDGDGRTELVFWNQRARKLWMAEIPAQPQRQENWQLTEIWSWPKAFKYEGFAKADINLDGTVDLIGGGMWFEDREDGTFTGHAVDADYGSSRSAAGDLIKGGRYEIVLGSGDTVGPLNLYEYRDGRWEKTVLIDVVDHGHTLEVADINGDGCLDIFTAEMAHWSGGENRDAKLWILYGDGAGRFEITELEAAEGLGNHESKMGDLDGDGDLDILQKPFEMDDPNVNIDIWLNNGTTRLGSSWQLDQYEYRTGIRVGAAGYVRDDKPVEVEIDFSKLIHRLGANDYVDPTNLIVLEHGKEGYICVPFQFDRAAGFHPWTDAHGTLTFVLDGRTPSDGIRQFHVYFGLREGDTAPMNTKPNHSIRVETVADHEGQESFRIQSPAGTYYYHKLGAGFASLIDQDGADWLSYHPGVGAASNSGSGGKYRGTPNMGHPEGYCHPGNKVSDSRMVANGPIKVTIDSESHDGKMNCRWDVFPHYARMTLRRMRKPYWYLYEGTPGGKLDMSTDFCLRPGADGFVKTTVSETWDGDIPSADGAEWVYFADPRQGRCLYLVHHEDDGQIDSYWPMNEEMTVFGFGRLGLKKFIQMTPSHFTIGLVDQTEPEKVKAAIDSAWQPLTVAVGPAESRR